MKKVPHGGEIDISKWHLKVFEKLDLSEIVREAATEALGHALEEDHTYIYFPVEYDNSDGLGGKAVDDPLTVYLRVGLDSDTEKPTYEFNIRECLKHTMERCTEDGSYFLGLEKLMYALRSLADEIGAVLESIPEE